MIFLNYCIVVSNLCYPNLKYQCKSHLIQTLQTICNAYLWRWYWMLLLRNSNCGCIQCCRLYSIHVQDYTPWMITLCSNSRHLLLISLFHHHEPGNLPTRLKRLLVWTGRFGSTVQEQFCVVLWLEPKQSKTVSCRYSSRIHNQAFSLRWAMII